MGTEITTTKPGGIQGLMQTPAVKSRFDEVLGKRAPAFISSVISAVNANPLLRECNPMTVVSAAAIAASVDLPINPSLGLAHIVPYKGSAQFQMGWKGFVQLALRSGQYKTINAAKVFEGQIKYHNPFTGEMEFNLAKPVNFELGSAVGYLLYFKLLNGYEKYVYMTRDECEAHARQYSSAYKKNFGPWVDNFDAMALKTVVKLGLSKYGPLSVEMQRAIEMDQAEISEAGESTYIDNEQPKIETKTVNTIDNLNKKIRQKKAEVKNEENKEDEQAINTNEITEVESHF